MLLKQNFQSQWRYIFVWKKTMEIYSLTRLPKHWACWMRRTPQIKASTTVQLPTAGVVGTRMTRAIKIQNDSTNHKAPINQRLISGVNKLQRGTNSLFAEGTEEMCRERETQEREGRRKQKFFPLAHFSISPHLRPPLQGCCCCPHPSLLPSLSRFQYFPLFLGKPMR